MVSQRKRPFYTHVYIDSWVLPGLAKRMTIGNAPCTVLYIAALFEGRNREWDSRACQDDVDVKDRVCGEAGDSGAPNMLDAEDTSDSINVFVKRGFDGIECEWPLRVVGFYDDAHFFFQGAWGVGISDHPALELRLESQAVSVLVNIIPMCVE